MLKFDENERNVQVLALYYSTKVGNKFVIDILSSKKSLSTPKQAECITKVFWEMVDMAINDNEQDISIEGIADLEFWMYQLLNHLSGYVAKKGFKKQWDSTTKRVSL